MDSLKDYDSRFISSDFQISKEYDFNNENLTNYLIFNESTNDS